MQHDIDRVIVIEAGCPNQRYWQELWEHRELLWLLCCRDLIVRYKQTVLGLSWAVFKPLITILTFTILLGKVARLPSEPSIPYSVMIFSGLLMWNFFSQCLNSITTSLLANGNLLGKIYLPRLIIPASTLAVALVDLAVSLALFAGFMLWYGLVPPVQCLTAPFFILLTGTLALGPGLILAGLTMHYRDMNHAVPVLVGLGIYATPVYYTSALIPQKWRFLYDLNPMSGIVDGFRWAVLGTPELPVQALIICICWTAVLLWWGIRVFRNMERTIVDVL